MEQVYTLQLKLTRNQYEEVWLALNREIDNYVDANNGRFVIEWGCNGTERYKLKNLDAAMDELQKVWEENFGKVGK